MILKDHRAKSQHREVGNKVTRAPLLFASLHKQEGSHETSHLRDFKPHI